MNKSSFDPLTDIYGARDNNKFLIKDKCKCGHVVYLDEEPVVPKRETEKPQDLDLQVASNMFGGKESKRKAKTEEKPLFPSMCDIDDKEIQEFIRIWNNKYSIRFWIGNNVI